MIKKLRQVVAFFFNKITSVCTIEGIERSSSKNSSREHMEECYNCELDDCSDCMYFNDENDMCIGCLSRGDYCRDCPRLDCEKEKYW